MKKCKKALIAALCLAVGACSLIACRPDAPSDDDGDKITVTYYDATGTNKPSEMTVLKTEKIERGGVAERYTPTKDDGYEFVNWFATPSKSHKFNFEEEINEDISIYAGFSKYVADTRDFYVIGAGKSSVLLDGWEFVKDEAAWNAKKDAHKFTKTEGKNEYSFTLDLRENDQFVIAATAEYHYKHGAGYLSSFKLDNGTEVFEGQGSVYDDSAWGRNILVKHSGNYTLTVTTHPNEDWFDENGNNYTEDRKEVYARNPYDTIEWVRNGDCLEELEVVTNYYIKGAKITDWKDMYNAATKMTEVNGIHSLSIYLAKDEEFMFTSTNTVGEETGAGAEYLRSDNLDEDSKAYLDENDKMNMIAKANGMYTFTYDPETGVLSVTFDADAQRPATDYYIDGTFAEGVENWNGYCFNEAFQLKETAAGSGVYSIKNVAMKADSEFIIQAFKAGATDRGEWGTESYNGLGSYNYTYLYGGGDAFSAVGGGNNNIKVKTAGSYDITFDSYSKMITVVAHSESADTLDIYIKGSNINGWSHGWSEDYLFTISEDEKTYEFTLTVEDGKAVEFGCEKHPKGEKTGYGTFLSASAIGEDGDANESFVPETGTNFTCSVAGTYKVVYTIETGKIDFYTVA